MSDFTDSRLTIKFFNVCELWKCSQALSMKQYRSGFSHVCFRPAGLSFAFEKEGSPTLHCEISLVTRVLWSGQDSLEGDGTILDF